MQQMLHRLLYGQVEYFMVKMDFKGKAAPIDIAHETGRPDLVALFEAKLDESGPED
jgi:hypothetical protein